MALWGLTFRHLYCLSRDQIGLTHRGIPLFWLLNSGKNAFFSPSQLLSPSHRRWLSYSTCKYCIHIVFLINALCTRIICIDFLDNQMHGLTQIPSFHCRGPYFISLYIIFISLGLCQGWGLRVGLGSYRHPNAFDYFTYVHVDIVYTFCNHAQLFMLTSIMYMQFLHTHYLHAPVQ